MADNIESGADYELIIFHWPESVKDPKDDNVDVQVNFPDGSRYAATFFTYKNIQSLRDYYKESGECLGGKYFWAAEMILIEEISEENIRNVIRDLRQDGYFKRSFQLLEELND